MSSIFQSAEQAVSKELTRARWAIALNGVLAIALGVAIIIWPNISLYTLVLLFGAFTLAAGVVRLVAALQSGPYEGRGWSIVNGLLGIAVGVFVFFRTDISAVALLYVIGFYAIAIGVTEILGAYWLPVSSTGDRILLGLLGVISILFGVVMFAQPGDGAIAVLALIAAYLLIVGLIEVAVAIGGEKLFERVARSASTPTKAQPSH